MAGPTPSASCPPCSDTPLAITTSVITFLTFLYALTAGLFYYYGLAKSSPKEIRKFIHDLYDSLKEVETLAIELERIFKYQEDTRVGPDQHEDEISYGLKTELNIVLSELTRQMISLQHSQEKVDGQNCHSSRRTGRLNYLVIRDELQQRVLEKHRLMTELRHIHQKSVSIFPVLRWVHL